MAITIHRLEVPAARFAVLIACLTLAACGGEAEFIAPPPVVASVDVTPQTATLVALGWRVQLSATARDSSGSAIPGANVQWSSSTNSVATVDSSGLVTAVGNGFADITATADGVSGTATVVVQQEAAYLDFTSPPPATIVGDTIGPVLDVAIRDLGGTTVSDATDTVTVAIGTNPGSAVLGGTTTVSAVGGVASFSDLVIDQDGLGYTLLATASRLYRATSAAFDIWPSLARIDSVAVFRYYGYTYPPPSADTLHIDRFRVGYAVSVSSIATTTLTAVQLQSYIDQGPASRAAGETAVLCTDLAGDLPPGTCAFNYTLGASNTAPGSGTLVAGDATARFVLRDSSSDTVLHTLTIPVTLVESTDPPLPRVRIDTVKLSSTTLALRASPIPYTATVTSEESATVSSVVLQGFVDQGFRIRAGGGTNVRCGAASGDLPPGTCSFGFTLGLTYTYGLVTGAAVARFELRDSVNDRVLDTFFVRVRVLN
ncbi:MAG: Ig-like domain-containing protein [Gemmatimonadota bacterium]|nr:MAG: Ig-like domain-containing protein [Gemmatimonadota bacterium]